MVWAYPGVVIALQDKFGAERVRSWYFELWNEPDISSSFAGSTQAMLNNYDATIAAIKDIDPDIRFGGPDTTKIANMFRDFFVHLKSGLNVLTGAPAAPPDYISFHVKGHGLQKDSVRSMIETELRGHSRIIEKHPASRNLPILVTECDLVSEAQRPLKWRATSEYPAQLCRLLRDNYRLIRDGKLPLTLYINDNAKAQDFEQRRLLARFIDEDTERFELVKKPVLNLMTALSLLGSESLEIHNAGVEEAGFGAIATKRDGRQVAVLLFNAPEEIADVEPTRENRFVRGEKEHGSIRFNLNIQNMSFKNTAVVLRPR